MTTLKLPPENILIAKAHIAEKFKDKITQRPPRVVKQKPKKKKIKPEKDYPIRTMHWPYQNTGGDND